MSGLAGSRASSALPRRPEEAPGGHGPDARGERFDLAAAGDDEAEAPGVAGDAAHGQRAEDVGQRSGVGAVGVLAGLEDADGELSDGEAAPEQVDQAARVKRPEVFQRGCKIPRKTCSAEDRRSDAT